MDATSAMLNEDDTLLEEILGKNINSEEQLIEEIKFRKENSSFFKSDSSSSGKKKRSSSKMAAHNQNSRLHLHRPSVRSISEQPNVIGASRTHYSNDACTYILIGLTWFLIIIFFPFSLMFIFRVVQEYERGIILGVFQPELIFLRVNRFN